MNIYSMLSFLPDKIYLQLMYFYHFKKFINFNKPITYNEKLQYLKLNDRKNEYVQMVDKIVAKDFVAERIGVKHIIPTLKVWNNASELAIEDLPEKFVLKCNHDSKSVIICQDKTAFDLQYAKKYFEKKLKVNGFYYGREWPYKNVEPKIFAEEYLCSSNEDGLIDYKFYTFDGVARFVMITKGRSTGETTADYYDMSYNHLDIQWGYPNSKTPIEKPKLFDEMIYLAQILAKGTKHLRVDFYCENNKIYFGELTFYDASGFAPFEKEEWDLKIGEYINL